jgi:murein DD-endopeptidase MepM/ murein hydrolase activator NlpD
MNKDNFSQLIPLIMGLALIFVKAFVLVMVVLLVLILYVIPQSSTVIAQDSLPGVTPMMSTSTLSPEDAAIANSEWSGARIIKTSLPASTPFIVPLVLPTAVPIAKPNTDNASLAAVARPPSINSPLEGFGIGDLPELISQEFKVPPPGEDSGHHGVDFAFWNRGNKPILGNPIKSVFSGKIAMSDAQEKPPYGFALMIETPLETIPQNLIHAINIPTQPIGTTINNKLNCPDLSKDQWNSTSKSLYTLYGHMISAPGFKVGEAIQIGQTIGFVGNSGYSSAAHLHLEMRIGPSGASFSNMGHYDPVTTEEDRHNYCNWRVSGVFQMFDPMDLFKASLVTK